MAYPGAQTHNPPALMICTIKIHTTRWRIHTMPTPTICTIGIHTTRWRIHTPPTSTICTTKIHTTRWGSLEAHNLPTYTTRIHTVRQRNTCIKTHNQDPHNLKAYPTLGNKAHNPPTPTNYTTEIHTTMPSCAETHNLPIYITRIHTARRRTLNIKTHNSLIAHNHTTMIHTIWRCTPSTKTHIMLTHKISTTKLHVPGRTHNPLATTESHNPPKTTPTNNIHPQTQPPTPTTTTSQRHSELSSNTPQNLTIFHSLPHFSFQHISTHYES